MSLPDTLSNFLPTQESIRYTTPTPPPLPTVEPTPTAFEVSPFQEKVTVDPYQTHDLQTLSKPQLAIDPVVDYLSSVLPPEMVAELKKHPDLIKLLLQKGQSLEKYVMNLMQELPASLNPTALLRNVGLMNVITNLSSFKNGLSSMGINLSNFPDLFSQQSLTFMSQIRQALSGQGLMNMGSSALSVNGLNLGSSNQPDPVAIAGISLAQLSTLAAHPISLPAVLQQNGISNTRSITTFAASTTSHNFTLIAGGTSILGLQTATTLVNAIATYGAATVQAALSAITHSDPATFTTVATLVKQLGLPQVTLLARMTSVSGPSVLTVANGIAEYGVPTLTTLSSFIKLHGATILTQLLTLLNGHTADARLAILTDIQTRGVGGYISYYGPDYNADLVNVVSTYGIDVIMGINAALGALGATSSTAMVTAITTLGVDDVIALLASPVALTPTVLIDTLQTLNGKASSVIAIALTQIQATSADTVLALTDAITKLSTTDIGLFITAVSQSNTSLLLQALPDLAVISTAVITAIAAAISSYEPSTLIMALHLPVSLEQYTLRAAMEIYAATGNYRAVLDLVTNYTAVLSVTYRRQLIKTIMMNFVLSQDELLIGSSVLASILAVDLNTICPNWNDVIRNGAVIDWLTPWVTASDDFLTTMKYSPTLVGLDATLIQNYRKQHMTI